MDRIERNGITEGVIWKQLLRFFFPIFLGTLFQSLYNTVDAIIVSNVLGKQALAALGGGTATSINLLIGLFTGIASGATVIISQHYGAKEDELVSKAIHNACAFAFWGGIALSLIGVLVAKPLLEMIGTPSDVLPLSTTYMRIYFSGTAIVVMYNIGAGIFRAFGDSKHPFWFLVAGCLVNIVLDILFVAVLGFGIAGAAYATVLSQLLSLILVVTLLRRRTDCCRLVFRNVKFNMPMLRRTLAIGLPAGFQSTLYTVSNLMIVSAINSFGTDTVAAWSAYDKIDPVYWMFSGALGVSITTFVGQNYGAGLIDRAKKGVRSCFAIGIIGCVAIESVLLVLAEPLYRMFVKDEAVISIGLQIMHMIVPFFFTFLCVEVLSGAIRGTGKAIVPTLLTAIGVIGFRTVWILIVPRLHHDLSLILVSYPISWTITSIAFVVYYMKGHVYEERKALS